MFLEKIFCFKKQMPIYVSSMPHFEWRLLQEPYTNKIAFFK